MKELITVFTPTYNRADLLTRVYDSLCRQTSTNFKWIIVDDGSNDNTKELCDRFINKETRFNIKYIYKENGGLHTTYNTVVPLLDTELLTCLESDDYFVDDAIEQIEKLWNSNKTSEITGIITLCKYQNGKIIGDFFQDNVTSTYFYNHTEKAKGDKQFVLRTDLLKAIFPQKVYYGERYFDPKYSFYELDKYGKFIVSNKITVVAEYVDGGLTKTMFEQYYNSPNSFIELRKLYMELPNRSVFYLLRQNIHYVSSCIIAGKLLKGIKESKNKFYTLLCLIPGFLLSIYIKLKNKKLWPYI